MFICDDLCQYSERDIAAQEYKDWRAAHLGEALNHVALRLKPNFRNTKIASVLQKFKLSV